MEVLYKELRILNSLSTSLCKPNLSIIIDNKGNFLLVQLWFALTNKKYKW